VASPLVAITYWQKDIAALALKLLSHSDKKAPDDSEHPVQK